MPEVESAVHTLDPQMPIVGLETMRQSLSGGNGLFIFRAGAALAAALGFLGVTLAVVGVYGVASFAASQRTREIGIRMALGAQQKALTGMFVRQGLTLTAIGIAFGLGAAFISMRLMSSLLFHVSPMDPWTYLLTTLCVIGIAWLACYLRPRRAAVVNPVNALRAE